MFQRKAVGINASGNVVIDAPVRRTPKAVTVNWIITCVFKVVVVNSQISLAALNEILVLNSLSRVEDGDKHIVVDGRIIYPLQSVIPITIACGRLSQPKDVIVNQIYIVSSST